MITFADRPGIGLLPHSAARYNLGCRCLTCTDLHTALEESRRLRLPTAPRHGTVRCFRAGCTCTLCRVAANEYVQHMQQRRSAR